MGSKNSLAVQNNIGCIGFCEKSKVYAVGLGNIYVNLNKNSLQQLKRALDLSNDNIKFKQKEQRIFIETPLDNFYISLTQNELLESIDLINKMFFEEELADLKKLLI